MKYRGLESQVFAMFVVESRELKFGFLQVQRRSFAAVTCLCHTRWQPISRRPVLQAACKTSTMFLISYQVAKILYQYYIYTAGPLHFFCRIPRTYSHITILFSLGKLHTVPPPHGFLLQPSPSLGEFRDDLDQSCPTFINDITANKSFASSNEWC